MARTQCEYSADELGGLLVGVLVVEHSWAMKASGDEPSAILKRGVAVLEELGGGSSGRAGA